MRKSVKRLLIAAAAVPVLLVTAAAGAVYLPDMMTNDGRAPLRARTSYTKGRYLAFVQPWGADQTPMMATWGTRADSIRIDETRFPNRSRFNFRWPPYPPGNTAGVWGYDHIAYGDYDGGEPEVSVPPVQLKALKAARQVLKWSGDFTNGQSTVLTEFYLRSDPADGDSKLLEVGWMLHVSPESQAFVESGKQLGTYRDDGGRDWRVAREENYLTFSPTDALDVTSAAIDMMHALRWLQAKKLVTGEAWLTGVAIGVEPFHGYGHVELETWDITIRGVGEAEDAEQESLEGPPDQ